MRGQVVRIKHIPNLKVGEPHQCHFNAYEYAMKNKCEFVCGFLGHTPHCICRQNGEYIDPTLNKESYFKIFHIYTAEEIFDIFDEEGCAFIHFQGNYVYVYDGMRKLKEEELRDWWIYIANMQYEDCLVHH